MSARTCRSRNITIAQVVAPAGGQAPARPVAGHRIPGGPLLDRAKVLAGQMVVVCGGLAVVEALVRSGRVSQLFLSQPSAVFQAFGESFFNHVLPAAVVTLAEIAISLAASAALGLVLGYLLWRYDRLGRAWEVLLAALFASPTLLLYPIALVFFGRTPTAIVVMSALVGVVPVILNTREALLQVNPVLIRFGRSLRLSDRRIFWTILLPAAGPGIFGGLQVGLSFMFKSVLAMEFIVNIGGLGRLVAAAFDFMDTKQVYVGITAVVLVAIIFVSLLARIERGLRRAK